jgi:hypothetical protein
MNITQYVAVGELSSKDERRFLFIDSPVCMGLLSLSLAHTRRTHKLSFRGILVLIIDLNDPQRHDPLRSLCNTSRYPGLSGEIVPDRRR